MMGERAYVSRIKIGESKDMCSSPTRTPKSQLAAEQSSTGGCWNPPKKIPHIQGQRRSRNKMVRRGAITLKSNFILTKWATHKLENNDTKYVLTLLKRF